MFLFFNLIKVSYLAFCPLARSHYLFLKSHEVVLKSTFKWLALREGVIEEVLGSLEVVLILPLGIFK